MERNGDARVNFSESPGATGDTGDTAPMTLGVRLPRSCRDHQADRALRHHESS